MLRKIFIIALMSICVAGAYAQEKSDKKAKAKRDTHSESTAEYAMAMKALTDTSFIVGFDKVYYNDGGSSFLNSRTNFLSVNGNHGTLQLIVDPSVFGNNGLGGVTVDGNISDIKTQTNKRGVTNYRMNLNGHSISCNITISIAPGSHEVRTEIVTTFEGNRISLDGILTPYVSTNIQKGRAE